MGYFIQVFIIHTPENPKKALSQFLYLSVKLIDVFFKRFYQDIRYDFDETFFFVLYMYEKIIDYGTSNSQNHFGNKMVAHQIVTS